jgi:hypothetical protein
MRVAMCVGLVAILSLLAVTAEATWPVHFYVDSEPVALLQAESPFAGPVKLEGRSGPEGTDERSGLFDNVRVTFYWDAHGLYWPDDDFETLDLLGWGVYGGPSPHLLGDFGNPAPCLMASGDSLCASGVYTLAPPPPLGSGWLDNWYFEVDVYVQSSADFHAVEFGIADDDAPSGPPGQQTLGLLAGVTWTNNAQGESVLRFTTDVDCAEIPAGAFLDGWHTIGFSGSGFSPVEAPTWGRVKAIYR